MLDTACFGEFGESLTTFFQFAQETVGVDGVVSGDVNSDVYEVVFGFRCF